MDAPISAKSVYRLAISGATPSLTAAAAPSVSNNAASSSPSRSTFAIAPDTLLEAPRSFKLHVTTLQTPLVTPLEQQRAYEPRARRKL